MFKSDRLSRGSSVEEQIGKIINKLGETNGYSNYQRKDSKMRSARQLCEDAGTTSHV